MNFREREKYIIESKKNLSEWVGIRDQYEEKLKEAEEHISYFNAVIESLANYEIPASVGSQINYKARVNKWTKPAFEVIRNNKKPLRSIEILTAINPNSESKTTYSKDKDLSILENVLSKMISSDKIKKHIKDGEAYYGLSSWFEGSFLQKEYLQLIE
jgi:hypothetical protein